MEAPDAIKWLNELGVMFDKDADGTMITTHGGGTSRKRMHACKDYSGAEIMRTLRDEVINRGIPVVEFTSAVELIRDEKVNPRSQNPKGFPRVYCILSSPPRQTAVPRLRISAIKNSLPEQYAEKRIYPADNGRIACPPAAANNLSPAPRISSCLKSCTAAWLRRLP